MDFKSLELVDVAIDRSVGTITLNRPERLNAYTTAMGIELFSVMRELDRREDVRAIIVTGRGRHFCAGAGLDADGSTFAGEDAFVEASRLEAKVRPWNMGTPVIAAINGAAVGIGATLPLLWDIRIMTTRSKIGFVFTRRGIMPEANSTWILPRLVGLSKALDLLLTGRFVMADEALAMGLVSRVVEPDDLMEAANEVAHDIATNTAPVSVAVTKRLVWRQLMEDDPRRGKAIEDELFHWIGAQPDAAEGVKAFLEKREPRFTMGVAESMPAILTELGE